MKGKCITFATMCAYLILSGCGTTPVSLKNAEQVPKHRLLGFQEQRNEFGTMVVTRDEGFVGSGCFCSLYVNNQLAARFDTGETAGFFVPPGELLLKVGRDPDGKGLCSIGQDYWTQRESLIKKGEVKYFRMTINADGSTDIQRAEN